MLEPELEFESVVEVVGAVGAGALIEFVRDVKILIVEPSCTYLTAPGKLSVLSSILLATSAVPPVAAITEALTLNDLDVRVLKPSESTV